MLSTGNVPATDRVARLPNVAQAERKSLPEPCSYAALGSWLHEWEECGAAGGCESATVQDVSLVDVC